MTAAELRDAERFVDLLRPASSAAAPAARAPPARPAARAAGDVPAQPGHRRAHRLGLEPPRQGAAPARRPVRHLGLDGAPLAPAPALRPGARARIGRPHRVVRVRDAADPGHPRAARTATATARSRGSRTPSPTGRAARGSGSASASSTTRWARRMLRTSGVVIVVSRRLGPRRSGARARSRRPASGATATG